MIRPFINTRPKIHDSTFITDDAIIIGDVEIGEDSSVWYGSVIRGDVNYIRIGARTNIQDMTMIHVSSKTHCTIVEDEVTVAVQVMGKLRDTITVAKGLPKDQLEALALAAPNVARTIDGAPPKKIIVVPDRLVNIVL